jgi:hypothetical protein
VDLYLDVHTTDGLDFQYDITYAYHGRAGTTCWSPRISAWLDQSLSPAVEAALQSQHHLPLNLYVTPVSRRWLKVGLRESQMPPRFSLGYGDLRHLPSVLIETHSLKPYRQRVLGTLVFLETALRHLGQHAPALRAAIAADQASRPEEVILSWTDGGPRRELDFQGLDFETYVSPASGRREVRWLNRPRLYAGLPVFTDRAGRTVKRPAACWVPVTKPQVIDLLRLHGIVFERLPEAREVEVTLYRLVPPAVPEPVAVEDGRVPGRIVGTLPERRRQVFPAGSAWVSLDQPLGDLALHLLEPLAADSLLRWGFFHEVFQRTEYIEGYVIAPLAEKLLAANAELRAEFEAKLASDPDFAEDGEARLQWFYQRTPFYDERYLLYPVGFTEGT